MTRLDRQSLALGLKRGLVSHERFQALPHGRHRGSRVLGAHGRPSHRTLRRDPRVLPGAPRARGLLEPVLGVGELLPGLRLAGARVALGTLGLLDLPGDRLEGAVHAACPPSDVVDPAQQADDIVDPHRKIVVALFELAHVCDEVSGAIVGHAPSIADDEGRYGCLVGRTVDTAPVDDSHSSALQLTAEEMRDAGYRAVDMLVRHLTDAEAPPLRRATRGEMRDLLGAAPPEDPTPFAEVLAGIERDVLPYRARGDHPGFFAFISYCGTWPGALGDLVSSAANVYASTWLEAPGPTQVELEVLGWFKEWIGYPETAAGILVSGGSAANMTALACARESLVGPMADDLVVYMPDQAHSSVARAARVLGFRPSQVRVLPVGDGFRLDPGTLRGAIDSDLTAGRRPLFVSVSGGSTNTGSIDPLPEIAEICRGAGAWLHVDAAYGGFAALTDRGRQALAGIELADSVTLDPHKWLYQSYECGCVLVRDGTLLRRAFEIAPDYLLDAVPGEEEVNFSDLGMQLSRTSHALKVWTSVRTFGVAAFRTAIDRSIDQALLAQRLIEESATLEIVSPAQLGVVCFRRRFDEAAGRVRVGRHARGADRCARAIGNRASSRPPACAAGSRCACAS